MRLRLFDRIPPPITSTASLSILPSLCNIATYRLTAPVSMAKSVVASNTTHNKPQIRSYQSRVTEQCLRNPCLQNLSQFLSDDILYRNTCRIACLEFSSVSANPCREDLDLQDLTSLLNNKVRGMKEIQGRLLLIEDLSKDVIELLGSSLNIDPFLLRLPPRYSAAGYSNNKTLRSYTTVRKQVSKFPYTPLPTCARARAYCNQRQTASRHERAQETQDHTMGKRSGSWTCTALLFNFGDRRQ